MLSRRAATEIPTAIGRFVTAWSTSRSGINALTTRVHHHLLQSADVIDKRQYALLSQLIGHVHLIRRDRLGVGAIAFAP